MYTPIQIYAHTHEERGKELNISTKLLILVYADEIYTFGKA